MSEQLTYSIRDLEELSGIPAHTIRTWERRYGLFVPDRNSGNVRYYHASDIAYLHQLVLLIKQGHRISSLARKSREEIQALVSESLPITQENDITEALCFALHDFDTQKVEGLLTCYIRKEGFDKAIETRIVPFLDQLSFLLLSGVLQTVHVQMFYSLLRQKVYAELDTIVPSRDGDRWVLAHDEDSVNGIYRDIMHYLLRKANRRVIVVGDVDASSMQKIVQNARPDGYCLISGGAKRSEWLNLILGTIPDKDRSQGKTLVLAPGKTLDFVNNSQIGDVVVLHGLRNAFNHMLVI